jgi:hypothetical protein
MKKVQKIFGAIGIIYLLTTSGCVHSQPIVREDKSITVPDGEMRYTTTRRVLDLDEDAEATNESCEMRSDTVSYFYETAALNASGRQEWRTIRATIFIADTGIDPRHDPLNIVDPDSGLNMSRATRYLLRQMETALQMKEPKLKQDYYCSNTPIPPANRVRTHMVKKLARDGYVRFSTVYSAWKRMYEISREANCGNEYARKGARDKWIGFAEQTLGLQMRITPQKQVGLDLKPAKYRR